jgi:hypothetical protein
MCLNPKWIYKKGFYKENNYRGYQGQAYELGTFSKCGVCEQCLAEKANNWVVRNYYEDKAHTRKCFLTLTYEHTPYILVKKDLQDFKKRLRINLDRTTGEKIRIFDAGEYGTLKGRPHFHLIIYGWDDEHAKYIGMNKKKNLLYRNDMIQKTWGLGRTTYQPFDSHQVPYLAMYESPKETFKKAYKLSQENGKILIKKVQDNIRMPKAQRENLYKELNEKLLQIENEKTKYMAIKEFNSWSLALGWQEFEKEYYKQNNYAFMEYIEDKEFCTPTPWVKKLANMGDIAAAQEMFRREQLLQMSKSEEEERIKNSLMITAKKKAKIMDWNDKKTEIEEIF